jgi:peptidoglycan/xylan/chitin deacetylase (PgdA/CDA1 family)
MSQLKVIILFLCRACGLFALARVVTKDRLRILCYHSFELDDESRFRGKMFLTGSTLDRRLQQLKQKGFPVVRLGEGLEGLYAGRLPNCAVAITIDDGFSGVARVAAPIFAQHNVKPTLYVTTARLQSRVPEHHLIVQYMFWKSALGEFRFETGWWKSGGVVAFRDVTVRKRLGKSCARALLTTSDVNERLARCREIATAIMRLGSFGLISPDEVRALDAQGFDIELHTHNHRLPADDPQTARREIEINREELKKWTKSPLEHFCYPSGDWSDRHWPVLASIGVRSATTCDPGLNDSKTNIYALKRFLDADSVSDIEFEAEMCGFLEWVRRLRTLGGLRPLSGAQPASDAI